MTVVTTCNNAVYEAAKVDGSAVLLESFRPEYLSHAFEIESNLQENTNQTPEIRAKRLLDKLKASVAAVERSNCLHSTMDRTLFEELVRSDNGYITRGVDNEKGRKVLFLRTGRLCKGIWRYKAGTPRGDAFVAAFNFWYHAIIANVALGAKGEELQSIIVSDVSEAGCLDFNPQLQSQSMELAVALFLPVPALVLVVGAPAVSRLFMKIVKAYIPEDHRKYIVDVPRREDIERYIGPSDTPSWWCRGVTKSLGVQHCSYDPRTTCLYAASARQGFSVTLSEIWNPGSWLDLDKFSGINVESVQTRRLPSAVEPESTLETIEADPSDEW